MRADLIDAGSELMLNLVEAKLRELATKANQQVVINNGLPSGSMSKLANVRLFIQDIIPEIMQLDDIASAIMKEVTRNA